MLVNFLSGDTVTQSKQPKVLTTLLVIFTTLFTTLLLSACNPASNNAAAGKATKLKGEAIGTTYSIIYLDPQESLPSDTLKIEFNQLINAANQSMSTYHPNSEISTFNKNESTEPVKASDTFRKVVIEGIRLHQMTEGALDITLKPLSSLWGFGPNGIPHTVPSDNQLTAVKRKTGVDKITIEGEMLSKSVAALQIDLNTIGKGFLVDQTAELLEQNDINNYLVEIGGEMRLKGFNDKGQPWKIGVVNPTEGAPTAQRTVFPGNNGIATSGDYYQYFEKDGKRYSHILNPVTGKPIDHNLASVTVLHPSAMTADGLATAIMVLGADKGLALAEKHRIPIYIIIRDGDKFASKMSSAFEAHLSAEQIEKTLN